MYFATKIVHSGTNGSLCGYGAQPVPLTKHTWEVHQKSSPRYRKSSSTVQTSALWPEGCVRTGLKRQTEAPLPDIHSHKGLRWALDEITIAILLQIIHAAFQCCCYQLHKASHSRASQLLQARKSTKDRLVLYIQSEDSAGHFFLRQVSLPWVEKRRL